jgi:putative hemolysin
MPLELLVIVLLALANGVFAGSEIAIISARPGRLRELAARGHRGARAALELRELPERFFATVQIGITVLGATAGAFGGARLVTDLGHLLARWPPLAAGADQLAMVLVVSLVSFLSLVLGELVPKSLALKGADRLAPVVAPPLLALARLLRPLVWLLTKSSNLVLWPFRDSTSFVEARLSADELVELLSEATRVGTLDARAGEIAARALTLPGLTVADVMVPRVDAVTLRRGASREELRRVLMESSHSRYPVVDADGERVTGYVSTKDLRAFAWEEPLFVLDDLVRPARFVPPGMKAVALPAALREWRTPFAIVVDEHGTMAGLVTLEDVLEELVGEMLNERQGRPSKRLVREPGGSVLAPADLPLRELNRATGLALPEGAWVTLAGLCLALAQHIPSRGERLVAPGGVVLEIVEASARRVQRVRVVPPGEGGLSGPGRA